MPNPGYPTADPRSSSQINSLLNPLMQPRVEQSQRGLSLSAWLLINHTAIKHIHTLSLVDTLDWTKMVYALTLFSPLHSLMLSCLKPRALHWSFSVKLSRHKHSRLPGLTLTRAHTFARLSPTPSSSFFPSRFLSLSTSLTPDLSFSV